ncbi:hypothetical protein QWZ13_14355 [Reinekea marina]|nr:hypothetical protein [Reinekea marina]MDN3650098.1 hypothetical protein [Reinekea marina]
MTNHNKTMLQVGPPKTASRRAKGLTPCVARPKFGRYRWKGIQC